MDKSIPVLTRLLLPVKDSALLQNILPLVELISTTMAGELEKVDLLHVVGGSFLSTHLNNIDFRAGHVLSSDVMRRLRDKHYQETVDPLLLNIQQLLQKSGVALKAKVRVEDGDPVKKISEICESEGYTTLIMSRRKGEEEGVFFGTVLNGLIGRHIRAGFYIVGEEGFAGGISPAARIMIGIDGSQTCLRAVEEAGVLLAGNTEGIEEVSLVNIMDPSCLHETSGVDCQLMIETGYDAMLEAENILVQKGVEKSKIVATVLFGKPGEMLHKHAQACAATMCYVGRRNRSKIAEIVLGSVSSDFIHRCKERTVVLVS
jgi:nucleotide-binding universal stress UspA family protein